MNYKLPFLLAGLLLAPLPALAGMVQGHRVIWVNLASEPGRVDQHMRSYFEGGTSECLSAHTLVFMRSKPKGITRQLVRRALIQKEAAARVELNKLLQRPFPEAEDGFDGIVAYSDQPSRQMYGLTRGRKKIATASVQSTDGEDLEISYCKVSPEIVRLP